MNWFKLGLTAYIDGTVALAVLVLIIIPNLWQGYIKNKGNA